MAKAKLNLKAKRRKLEFDYEFEDGDTIGFKYLSPTTRQIDLLVSSKTQADTLKNAKTVFIECLEGDKESVNKLVDDLTNSGNIYEFRETLDIELGKLKRRG